MDRVLSTIATIVADTTDASEHIVVGYDPTTDSFRLRPRGVCDGAAVCLVDREDFFLDYWPVGHV
jgi:hypothetical protein